MKKKICLTALLALLLTLISTGAMAACGYTWTKNDETYTCTETDHTVNNAWSESATANQCIHYVYHYDETQRTGMQEKVVYSDHNLVFVEYDQMATCQQRGAERKACSVCEYPVITYTDKADHYFDQNGQTILEPATCQHAALVRQHCIYGCGAYQDVYYGKAESFHNTATKVGREATCGKDGYYLDYCSWCDKELGMGDVIPATGEHTYGAEEVVQEPNCTINGMNIKVCTGCGQEERIITEGGPCNFVKITESCNGDAQRGCDFLRCTFCLKEKDMVQHTGSYEKTDKAPSCTESGATGYYCSECDVYLMSRPIPMLEHQYASEVYQAPTCVLMGSTRYYCTNEGCSESYVKEDIPATERHEWYLYSHKEATCTEYGSTEYRCTGCTLGMGETKDYLGHDYEVESEVPATCVAPGSVTKKCSRCDHVYTYEVPEKQHSPVRVAEVPPTCTKDGRTAGVQCNQCWQYFEGGDRIPAQGTHRLFESALPYPLHYNAESDEIIADYDIDPATCSNPLYNICFTDRNMQLKCECGKEWKVTIPAAGKHINFETGAYNYCPTCGECEHWSYGDASRHEVVREPGCYEDGIQMHICNIRVKITAQYLDDGAEAEFNCDDQYEEPLYATGHAWGEEKTAEDGTRTVVCTKCGEEGILCGKTCSGEHDFVLTWDGMMCRNCGKWSAVENPEDGCRHEEKDRENRTLVMLGDSLYEGRKCVHCGAYCYDPIPIPHTPGLDGGHNHKPWYGCDHEAFVMVTEKEAACEQAGKNYAACTECGIKVATGTIPALGHDWEEEMMLSPEDCNEDALVIWNCKRCDAQETKTLPGGTYHLGRGFELLPGGAPYPLQYDSESEQYYVDYDHPSNARYAVPFICFNDQEITIKCSYCNEALQTLHIPAAGYHVSYNGNEEDGYCATCGECFHSADEDLQYARENYAAHQMNPEPTCEQAGLMIHTCGKENYVIGYAQASLVPCGFQMAEVIPAPGHDWSEWEEQEDGSDIRACKRCGEQERCEAVEIYAPGTPVVDEYPAPVTLP